MAYQDFFGFREHPFTLHPDPRFFYLSDQHRKALEKSRQVAEQRRGLGVVYGTPGTGKTTLSRILFQQYLDQRAFETVLLATPDYRTDNRFLRTIIQEFGVGETQKALEDSLAIFSDFLAQKLEKQQQTCLLIIDHAEIMQQELYALIDELLEIENKKDGSPLLQVVLFGRDNMKEKLNDPRSRNLDQKITMSASLKPMSYEEMVNKLTFRMLIAGVQAHPFTEDALQEIFRASKGVPRVVNRLADKSLYESYMRDAKEVDKGAVLKAEKVLGMKHEKLILKDDEPLPKPKTKRGRPPKGPKRSVKKKRK